MTDQVAASTEVGRACPYCRFPLKDGIGVHRCDTCGAVHHEDCWHEGHGCAVFGCTGSARGTTELPVTNPNGVEASPPRATAPQGATPVSPIPSTAPPQFHQVVNLPASNPLARRVVRRRGALGLLLCLALVAGAFAAYAIASSHKTRVVVRTIRPATPASSPRSAGSSAGSAQQSDRTGTQSADAEAAARQLNGIIRYSLAGRTDAQTGNYQTAIANRQTVLRRLGEIDVSNRMIARAVGTLRQAMDASLRADRAFASGSDPTAYDNEATADKARFASEWSTIASQYGLPQYSAGAI
jgi:hypothetical protein